MVEHATAEQTTAASKAKKEREVEQVTMDDGRKVEFVGQKRKMLKALLIPGEDDYDGALGVRFDFRDGRVISFEIPDSLLPRFAAHGAAQKIGDETAGETTVGDMWEAVNDICERLSKGEWSVEREGGGGFAGTSILLKALHELSGKPIPALRDFLKGKSKAEKDEMKRSAKLKHIVEKLEAEERAKAGHVDTDKLFDELESVAA